MAYLLAPEPLSCCRKVAERLYCRQVQTKMPLKGMEMKEMQMVKIGTRIIEDGGGEETAEAAKMRFAGQNSKLGSIILNVESGFKKCLEWSMMYMGGSSEPEIEVNKQFYDATIDPQLLMANIQLMESGVIAKSDVRYLMRKSNLIRHERTDEDLDKDVSTQSPLVTEEKPTDSNEFDPFKGIKFVDFNVTAYTIIILGSENTLLLPVL